MAHDPGTPAALGTVLGVWAHPDDETFLSAGLMALARAAGNRVVCVTATRGESGTDDPRAWPPQRLGALRALELEAALEILDVREHHWLGHVDGTCAAVPPDRGAEQVAEIVSAVRPDTVVTFGPEGMTGHPDHMAVSRWTALALDRVAPGARLLHATTTPEFAVELRDVNEALGAFPPGLPVATARGDLDLALRLDPATLERKVLALRAQASQTALQERRVGTDRFRAWWAEECFVSAVSRLPAQGRGGSGRRRTAAPTASPRSR